VITATVPAAGVGPTAARERIAALDAMRGLAILGVLVAYTVWSLGNPPPETWTRADRLVERAMDLFVDNKFLTMFACLFGVGVAQQWRRWEAAGYDPVPLHLRRMGFLLGVGLLHAVFLRNGDILAPYALLGLVLLAFRRRPSRALGVAIAILAVAPYLFEGLLRAIGVALAERPSVAGGNYLVENLTWLRYWYLRNPILSWPRVLALMLAGVLAGRSRFIERAAAAPALAARLLALALPLAIATRLLVDRLHGTALEVTPRGAAIADLLYQSSAWTLAAAYAAGLLLLSHRAFGARLLSPLRTLGRMAFTNYLLQALTLVPLCFAFGLFDRVSPMRGLWLACAVAALQFLFSAWWLARHPMGPFERLWRRVTYGSTAAQRA
jgi:uncharacterized protein